MIDPDRQEEAITSTVSFSCTATATITRSLASGMEHRVNYGTIVGHLVAGDGLP